MPEQRAKNSQIRENANDMQQRRLLTNNIMDMNHFG